MISLGYVQQRFVDVLTDLPRHLQHQTRSPRIRSGILFVPLLYHAARDFSVAARSRGSGWGLLAILWMLKTPGLAPE
jgi:hypothetical protein